MFTQYFTRRTERVDERIRRRTEHNVARYAAGGPDAIDRRLRELDREWDDERAWECTAAAATLIGTVMAAGRRGKWWSLLPIVAGGVLLRHAITGWHPKLPLFRAVGFRPPAEIDRERYALKTIRGDFRDLPHVASEVEDRTGVSRILEAVRR
jgi:hypothetical protein